MEKVSCPVYFKMSQTTDPFEENIPYISFFFFFFSDINWVESQFIILKLYNLVWDNKVMPIHV